uniref:DNA polymerase delta subunit 2 n=1 Tax=Anser brachyrhynchus TaxID=132585 RepID=A0A8B9I6L7_9AVES
MQLQPSILQEISEEVTAGAVPSPRGGGGGWARGAGLAPAAVMAARPPLPPWLSRFLLGRRPRRCWRRGEALSGNSPDRHAAGERPRGRPGLLRGLRPSARTPKNPPPGVPPSSPQHNLVPQPPLPKYVHPSDELILEDELQRIKLVGNVEVSKMVTGTILAVYGSEQEDGGFLVEELCFAELPQPLPWAGPSSDRFVLLASGLGLGSGSGESLLGTQLLVDAVTGQLGAEGQQSCAALISRVILAGNLLSQSTQSRDSLHKARYLTRKTQAASVEAVKMLDEILLQLCTSVPVDVMPGEFDPTNYTLPQQPLHHCMLPLASAYSTLQLVTNPYQADVDGVRFLGTSGQNISDIFKYSSMDDYLEILEWTLRAGHISPTAPDTLGCYPFYKSDPFILTDCPHVYFCGSAPRFQSKVITGDEGQRVLLVAVPAFSTTQTACLVNLRDLSCQPISFSGFGAEDDDGDMEVGQ